MVDVIAESKVTVTILKGQSPCLKCSDDVDLEITNERTATGVGSVFKCKGCETVLGKSNCLFIDDSRPKHWKKGRPSKQDEKLLKNFDWKATARAFFFGD